MFKFLTKANFVTIILASITLSALAYYLVKTEWNLFEIFQFCLGATLLWAPFGALFYLLLRKEIEDSIVRFTFSAIASYTITTLIYFGLAVLKIDFLFYILQALIVISIIIYLRRIERLSFKFRKLKWQQFDWVLSSLIAVSLVVNLPYQTIWEKAPDANVYTFVPYQDFLYHAGLSYELDRNVPPLQQSIRAGTPERAYHMFPHLTTMLLARFTGQADMLRAWIIYHYLLIKIGMCLVLYSTTKILTKSNLAGYIAAATMYITAISYPPLIENKVGYFYFTFFPHVSSGLEPVIVTSPQMYSGLLVAYGVFLGILLISIRFLGKQSIRSTLIITALMVAATSRFRAHIFIPMLPGFLLLLAYAWKCTKQKIYLLATSISLILSLLIYWEMQAPIYLKGTASLKLNFLTKLASNVSWINAWPFSEEIHSLTNYLIPNAGISTVVWEFLSIFNFVALNMIGIPLLLTTGIYLFSKSAFQEFRLFTALIIWMTMTSTLASFFLSTDYDPYSLNLQMLLTTRWYVLLLMISGLYQIHIFLQSCNRSLKRSTSIIIFILLIVLSLIIRQITAPSILMIKLYDSNLKLNGGERMALNFIHDHTPKESVILADKYVDKYAFFVSGLTGRAAYLEANSNVVDKQALKLAPSDDRREVLRNLWKTTELDTFCKILMTTPATHMLEYSSHPLVIHNPNCMKAIWESSNPNVSGSTETIKIWEVIPRK